ncbi:MAG: hypothetical protein AAGU15_07210 [Anaerolineaceae bacterium]
MLRALIRAVVAIPGFTAAGNVDPEILWQTERRNIWVGTGHYRHCPDHHRDRCLPWVPLIVLGVLLTVKSIFG